MGAENTGPSLTSEGRIHPIGRTTFPSVDYFSGLLEGLSRQERFENLENAIQPHARRGRLLVGRPILLVDDVMTSGATLMACAQACLDAGSGPVRVLTLARAAKDA